MLEFLFLVILALIVLLVYLFKKNLSLQRSLDELFFKKSSQSVKYGKLTEQWIPFSERFPFNPENFRFLGSPVDGIAFNEDCIVFVEFKTASSSLNEKQKKIKELIQNKKIEWFELKIN
jgi:predicted Holliday junction resolvase-like endonuclease